MISRSIKTLSLCLLTASGIAQETTSCGHSSHENCNHDNEKPLGLSVNTYLQTYFINSSTQNDQANLHGDLELIWRPIEKFSISACLKVEPNYIKENENNNNFQWFDQHEGFVEELKLNFELTDNLTIFAGKFVPQVGLNYHAAPGWYGSDGIDYYKISDRIGSGFSLKIADGDFGRHFIEASIFTADTTFLSHNVFGKRDSHPRCLDDGGIANTNRLDSYALQLRGENIYFDFAEYLHEFSYAIGFAKQEAARKDSHSVDENRIVAGFTYTFHFNDKNSFQCVNEIAQIDNEEGEENIDTKYKTTGAKLTLNSNWELAASYTDIDRKINDGGHLIIASIGYQINSNLGIHVGWKREQVESERNNIYGVMFDLNF